MSQSVIYVLFKSSKRAAPGINIITVKTLYIQSKSRTGNAHTHAHAYTLKQNANATFGARKGNSPYL